MMAHLDYETYARLSEAGSRVPVFRELPGDLRTPVSAFISLATRAQRAFLLESVLGGERLARYSFLGRDPVARIEVRAGTVEIHDAGGRKSEEQGLLAALRARLAQAPVEVPGLPRFTGGVVGYLTWDAVRLFEQVPPRPLGEVAVGDDQAARDPVASFALYDAIVAFDHVRQRLVLIALCEPGSRAAFLSAQQRLDSIEADLAWERRPPRPRHAAPTLTHPPADDAAFHTAVAKVKDHIASGDVLQVVLSRQASFDSALDPFSVYRALRTLDPSPYMYFLKEGETAIAGASAEMLVRVEGNRVETRPLTPARTAADGSAEAAVALPADDALRAEHTLLVDLARSDLGRVCRFGSVRATELMKVERFGRAAHVVSAVEGELRPGQDALDALVAAFPAGTVSGAPKQRARDIVDALENGARGLFGGALGYLDLRGNLDFCTALRTLVMKNGRVTFRAGTSIASDSDPVREARAIEAATGTLLEALALAGDLP